jgi:uracil-DNA glycosylase
VNVYKELESDLKISVNRKHGYLLPWAQQGVLLLNSVLTVESGLAASHQKKGWEEFTDAAIAALNRERENLVFVLWGSYAQKKCAFIDEKRHFVVRSVHPSPLSSHRGFFGSQPFSKANSYLESKGLAPIDWSLQ